MTDKELDDIISTPPERSELTNKHLLCYFDTMNGKVQPSYKSMCPIRMKELLKQFRKYTWCYAYHHKLIDKALADLK